MKNNGFTMVELLVVITIIVILITVAFGTFASVQRSSRDAKRQADLSVFQSNLEQYHADQNFYPSSWDLSDKQTLTSSVGRPEPYPTPAKTYLDRVPDDPNDAPSYVYLARPNNCTNEPTAYCSSYCLYANMENSSNVDNITNCPDQPSDDYPNPYELTPP